MFCLLIDVFSVVGGVLTVVCAAAQGGVFWYVVFSRLRWTSLV